MARFGDVDFRRLQSTRELLGAAIEGYTRNKSRSLELERIMAQEEAKAAAQQRLNQILNQTAESIKPKKVKTPVNVPKPIAGADVFAGALGLPVVDFEEQTAEKEVPLSIQERNRVIDEAALRAFGVPYVGQAAAEHLYRYREQMPKEQLSFEQRIALEREKAAGRARIANILITGRAAEKPKGDIFITDKGGNVVGVDEKAPTDEIRRTRENYEELLSDVNSSLANMSMYSGFGIDATNEMAKLEAERQKYDSYLNALKNPMKREGIKVKTTGGGGAKKEKITLKEAREQYKQEGQNEVDNLSDAQLTKKLTDAGFEVVKE